MSWKSRIYPPLLSFLGAGLLWEFLARRGLLDPALFPPPSRMAAAFFENPRLFLQAGQESLRNILIGWSLSLLGGLAVALLLSLSKFLRRAVLPFAIFFQTVPIIAVAPLLVIYCGFGAPTVIVSSCVVAIFPVIASTLIGLESPSRENRELFALYRAGRLQTLFKLKLPAAYAYIYAGLKVSAGLAVIGAVAGEFVAGGGLGALIDSARTQQRIDLVFVAILALSAIGLLLIGFLRLLNFILNLRRPYGLNLKD